MNSYEFSDENKECVLHLLQAAKHENKKYCNSIDHQVLTKLLPAVIRMQNDYENVNKSNDIIVITDTDSDEELEEEASVTKHSQMHILKDMYNYSQTNEDIMDDTLHSVKEHLQIERKLSPLILHNLNNLTCDQFKMFDLLSELKFEELVNFGISLKSTNICNNLIISYYLRYLLEKLSLEYSDQLQELLNDFSMRFSENLLEELIRNLFQEKNNSKVCLQFINGFSMDFKKKILRKLTFTCEKFYEDYFAVVEILIVTEVEFDTISKLFEILSNCEDNFHTHKSLGKLLINIMGLLRKNVLLFEQPLKHLIGSHKSIWKAKLKKKFDDCLQENSLLSQSFREI